MNLTRKVGAFKQIIHFQSSVSNVDDDCRFWTHWRVESREYAKWYEEQWGVSPTQNWIGGCADWNIPGWNRDPGLGYQLRNTVNDIDEMEVLLRNVIDVGLPYLAEISTWKGAASDLLRCGWLHDLACDFFLIAGDRGAARAAAEAGLRGVEIEGRTGLAETLPRLKSRLERYFRD